MFPWLHCYIPNYMLISLTSFHSFFCRHFLLHRARYLSFSFSKTQNIRTILTTAWTLSRCVKQQSNYFIAGHLAKAFWNKKKVCLTFEPRLQNHVHIPPKTSIILNLQIDSYVIPNVQGLVEIVLSVWSLVAMWRSWENFKG